MGNAKDGNNHIIHCSGKDRIDLKEGDFKKIKNYDPLDTIPEFLGLANYDVIGFTQKDGGKTKWFEDEKSGLVYAFMTDKNDKIIAGAIVEYKGSHGNAGIWGYDTNSKDHKAHLTAEYKADYKDKEEVKAYLKDKTKDHSGALEVTQAVSRPHLLDAVDGLASTNAKVGSDFKTSGAGFDKGSNSIG